MFFCREFICSVLVLLFCCRQCRVPGAGCTLTRAVACIKSAIIFAAGETNPGDKSLVLAISRHFDFEARARPPYPTAYFESNERHASGKAARTTRRTKRARFARRIVLPLCHGLVCVFPNVRLLAIFFHQCKEMLNW